MSRRPDPTAAVASEHAEQVAVLEWAARCAALHPGLALLFAVPNGGQRHPAVAARLRDEGVKPGVPDLVLPVARHGYHALFVELKRTRGGRVAPAQAAWHAALRAEGNAVEVCYGAGDAIGAISAYLDCSD